ncbi:hypothetical protein VTP01DRAFT_4372 [Rhizomucor pusillus]|uniref:uncharacterized protein n=1 Tax=Rhizomucor pusillus TaxID=4840 RepID=UPI0037431722
MKISPSLRKCLKSAVFCRLTAAPGAIVAEAVDAAMDHPIDLLTGSVRYESAENISVPRPRLQEMHRCYLVFIWQNIAVNRIIQHIREMAIRHVLLLKPHKTAKQLLISSAIARNLRITGSSVFKRSSMQIVLCTLTPDMDTFKASSINGVRRLMLMQIRSLSTSPEERTHLLWTNQKDTVRGVERLDSVIIVLSQSRWGQHFGHGEAKIAEPKENNYVLAWDLCRLAFFNKNP